MASAAELAILISGDDQRARAALKGAQQAVQDFERAAEHTSGPLATAESAFAGLAKAAAAVGVAFTAVEAGKAIVGFAQASIESTKQLDLALREVNSLFGLSGQAAEESFGQITQQVRGLAVDLGVNAVGATRALYEAISAGVPRENAVEFLAVATKAAIGGVTDTKTAVSGLTTVLQAFKLPASEVTRVADIMFQTVNVGKTRFEDLSRYLYNVAPLAAAAGVKFEEVAAAISAITLQGTPTAAATTQIRGAIQALLDPSDEARKLANALGLEFSATALQSKGFAGVLQDVYQAAGGNIEVLSTLFGNVEALQGVLSLTGENAATFREHLEGVEEAGGATQTAYEELNKSFARQFEQMEAKAEELKLRLGEHLLPVAQDVLAWVDLLGQKLGLWPATPPPPEQIERFTRLGESAQATATAVLALAEAIGAVGRVVGTIESARRSLFGLGEAIAERTTVPALQALQRQSRANAEASRSWADAEQLLTSNLTAGVISADQYAEQLAALRREQAAAAESAAALQADAAAVEEALGTVARAAAAVTQTTQAETAATQQQSAAWQRAQGELDKLRATTEKKGEADKAAEKAAKDASRASEQAAREAERAAERQAEALRRLRDAEEDHQDQRTRLVTDTLQRLGQAETQYADRRAEAGRDAAARQEQLDLEAGERREALVQSLHDRLGDIETDRQRRHEDVLRDYSTRTADLTARHQERLADLEQQSGQRRAEYLRDFSQRGVDLAQADADRRREVAARLADDLARFDADQRRSAARAAEDRSLELRYRAEDRELGRDERDDQRRQARAGATRDEAAAQRDLARALSEAAQERDPARRAAEQERAQTRYRDTIARIKERLAERLAALDEAQKEQDARNARADAREAARLRLGAQREKEDSDRRRAEMAARATEQLAKLDETLAKERDKLIASTRQKYADLKAGDDQRLQDLDKTLTQERDRLMRAANDKVADLNRDAERRWGELTTWLAREQAALDKAVGKKQAALDKEIAERAEKLDREKEANVARFRAEATEKLDYLERDYAKRVERIARDFPALAGELQALLDRAVAQTAGAAGAIEGPALPVQPQAAGGAGIVREPTLFLAGERGPEAYAFGAAAGTASRNGVTVNYYQQAPVYGFNDFEDSVVRAVELGRRRGRLD